MKTPKIVDAVGHIDEEFINEATKETKAKKNVWVKWCSMAACFFLVMVAVFGIPKLDSYLEPSLAPQDAQPPYAVTVSYVGWSDNPLIAEGALNKDKLSDTTEKHFPVYKMETVEELEAFKTTYGEVFDLNQGDEDRPSFMESITRAQYNENEAFFEDHSLLIVYVADDAKSFGFGLRQILPKGNSICVEVAQNPYPEEFTEEKRGWFITVAISDEEMANYTDFDAVYGKVEEIKTGCRGRRSKKVWI